MNTVLAVVFFPFSLVLGGGLKANPFGRVPPKKTTTTTTKNNNKKQTNNNKNRELTDVSSKHPH